MLQIITEKFYPPGERYETLHRAVFYTNYRILTRAARLETPIGVLLPTTGLDGIAAMTCEILEKIEKEPDKKPGVMISTGGTSLLNDFAAVTAFALNITCTPDPDLTRRLLSTERPGLGVDTVPSQFIRRTFDRQVISQDGDGLVLANFVTQLVGLERKRFEAAIRAIRQYITGLHRIADNLSLAYVMMVMSVESIAQNSDGQVAEWGDYDRRKREIIDDALNSAPPDVSKKIRDAILSIEHVATARRFRDFTLAHIAPSFFRDEAAQAQGPIGRGDLRAVLEQAYIIRSRYVHSLKEIPSGLTVSRMPELIEGNDRPMLSVAGLARVARHVIMQYVMRGPIVEREEFNYRHALPNIVTLPLASQYWIANTKGFSHKHGPVKLSAFIQQIVAIIFLQEKDANLTDIRPVLTLVEDIAPGLQSTKQRLPLLTLYYLFHYFTAARFHLPQWPTIFKRFELDFEDPSIESFVTHFLTDQTPSWTLDQQDALHQDYFNSRHRAGTTKIGPMLEAAFSLFIADLHRKSGNDARARELISFAVDVHPAHSGLRSFELNLHSALLPEISWKAILLPPPEAPQANNNKTQEHKQI